MAARVKIGDEDVSFKCPGCGWTHILNTDPSMRPCWGFNGDAESPTLTPSINAWREYGGDRKMERCHSFVTDGKIRFLNDSTHALKGQTVDLPDLAPETVQ